MLNRITILYFKSFHVIKPISYTFKEEKSLESFMSSWTRIKCYDLDFVTKYIYLIHIYMHMIMWKNPLNQLITVFTTRWVESMRLSYASWQKTCDLRAQNLHLVNSYTWQEATIIMYAMKWSHIHNIGILSTAYIFTHFDKR